MTHSGYSGRPGTYGPDHQARVVYVARVSNTHLADDLATDLPKLLHDRT